MTPNRLALAGIDLVTSRIRTVSTNRKMSDGNKEESKPNHPLSVSHPNCPFSTYNITNLAPFLSLAAFNILPHPAKDNQPGSNPGNLQGDPGSEGGLNASNPSSASGGMPGPHILDSETAQGLEAPKSREEVSDSLVLGLIRGSVGGHDWVEDG